MTLLIIINSILIFSFLASNKKTFLYLYFLASLPLLFIQIKQTQITDFSTLTEMETVTQISRLHQYPPYGYRLGHILEQRSESIFFFKLEKNFIDIFDLLIFPNIATTTIVLPFFIFGLIKGIKIYPKITLTLFLLPIILLTFIGHQNLSGPICLYPIIFAYSLFSLISKRSYEK